MESPPEHLTIYVAASQYFNGAIEWHAAFSAREEAERYLAAANVSTRRLMGIIRVPVDCDTVRISTFPYFTQEPDRGGKKGRTLRPTFLSKGSRKALEDGAVVINRKGHSTMVSNIFTPSDTVVTVAQWYEHFLKTSNHKDKASARKAFNRSLTDLQERGLIKFAAGYVAFTEEGKKHILPRED